MTTILALIDRQQLADAVREAAGLLARQHPGWEEWSANAAGGVIFLLTGEDGVSWDDDDIWRLVNTPDALANLLCYDLIGFWNGNMDPNDRSMLWQIANTIASAFIKAVRGGC